MVIGGLWHGASENFVVWGIMNGTALVIYKYWAQINVFFRNKSSLLYLLKPIIFCGIYFGIYTVWPQTWHVAVIYFLWFWIGMNIIVFIMRLLITALTATKAMGKYAAFLLIFFIAFLGLSAAIYFSANMHLPYMEKAVVIPLIIAWGAVILWITLTHYLGSRENFYERMKTGYISFWQILFTFGFISLTRIWFKLDDARHIKIGDTQVRQYTDAQVDAMPGNMLNQIWYKFNFTWEYLVKFVEIFYIPLIIMVIGLIMHWLPDVVKKSGEKLFMAIPMWLQTVVVAIIVLLMYQSLTAEPVPFVYMQF